MKKITVIVTEDNKYAVSDWGVASWYQDVLKGDGVAHVATVVMLDALRVGVMSKEIEPFKVEFKGETVSSYEDGKLDNWPEGFFDTFDKQLTKLCGF